MWPLEIWSVFCLRTEPSTVRFVLYKRVGRVTGIPHHLHVGRWLEDLPTSVGMAFWSFGLEPTSSLVA